MTATTGLVDVGWRRSWKVTVKRGLLQFLGAGVVGGFASLAAANAYGYSDVEISFVFAPALGSTFLVSWWIDHLAARRGAVFSATLVAATVGVVFASGSSGEEYAFAPTSVMVGLGILTGLAGQAFAYLVRNSFPPRRVAPTGDSATSAPPPLDAPPARSNPGSHPLIAEFPGEGALVRDQRGDVLWLREWSVTWRRTARMVPLYLLTAIVAGYLYDIASGSLDADLVSHAAFTYVFLGMVYLVFVVWWLDHLVSRYGRPSAMIAAVVGTIALESLGLVGDTGLDNDVGLTIVGLTQGVLAAVIGVRWASGVEGSFSPTAVPSVTPTTTLAPDSPTTEVHPEPPTRAVPSPAPSSPAPPGGVVWESPLRRAFKSLRPSLRRALDRIPVRRAAVVYGVYVLAAIVRYIVTSDVSPFESSLDAIFVPIVFLPAILVWAWRDAAHPRRHLRTAGEGFAVLVFQLALALYLWWKWTEFTIRLLGSEHPNPHILDNVTLGDWMVAQWWAPAVWPVAIVAAYAIPWSRRGRDKS